MSHLIKSFINSAKSKILACILCTGLGVFSILASYNKSGSNVSFGSPKSWGASIDPLLAAIGASLLVCACFLYKSYSNNRT